MEEKNELHMDLEDKNRMILMLTSLLQKKEEEIELLKADLDDSVAELGTVCDVSTSLVYIDVYLLTRLCRNLTLN